MGSDAAGNPQAQLPGNAFTRIADGRSWLALLVLAGVAVATTVRWHGLFWLWAVIVSLAFFRAGALVLAARAAGLDPEEVSPKKGGRDVPPAAVDP